MKKHIVNILYHLPDGSRLIFNGWVTEVIGDNGKAIVYPCGVFKSVFGFSLPVNSIISFI